MPAMNEKQIDKRIGELRSLLRLDHWYISTHLLPRWKSLPHCPERVGEVHYLDNDTYAFLNLAGSRPDEDLDFTLCHELAHVRLRELGALVEALFDGMPESAELHALRKQWEGAMERACDGIANALTEKTGGKRSGEAT